MNGNESLDATTPKSHNVLIYVRVHVRVVGHSAEALILIGILVIVFNLK